MAVNRPLIVSAMILLSIVSMNRCSFPDQPAENKADDFKYFSEQFADIRILRYQVPEFDSLSPRQKELVYYLSQAALSGRDIITDQNGKYNLLVRKTLEAIYTSYHGNHNTDEFSHFIVYLKRVWFSNGIYHHYSTDKFLPNFTIDYFASLVKNCDSSKLPLGGEVRDVDALIKLLTKVMFDPSFMPKRVYQGKEDLVANSACNYYEGVTEADVHAFYEKLIDTNDKQPIWYGLNSKLMKENGTVKEKVWKQGGMYDKAITQIIFWLEKAAAVAENETQTKLISTLIDYYKTGNLKTFDTYNILWVNDTASRVDFVNGFIEVYGDPLAKKAAWESIVNFRDEEATKRTKLLSENAQWFEDNAPIDPRFKKKEVKGIMAKVITLAMLGGDCYPSTPIGINLPNSEWIRKDYGSKSVSLSNIMYAYDQAGKSTGMLEEFSFSEEEVKLARTYGPLANMLHTDMHECLGHGSGQLLQGVSQLALKNYHSTMEEARADLFALYYLMDPKLVELGLIPSLDLAKAEYSGYIRGGLMTQMVRIELGKDLEESHMRNRQLIAKWCYEHGKNDKVIEKVEKNGKTYFVVRDFNKLRTLFGQLLAEVQRIKSEGDFAAAQDLVETYGVKLDPAIHEEALDRFKKLNLAPYAGFINPSYKPVMKDGKMIDVEISYPDDFTKQMLEYSGKYSFLDPIN